MLVFLVPLSFTLGLVLGRVGAFVLGDITRVIVPTMVSRVWDVEVFAVFRRGGRMVGGIVVGSHMPVV